MTPVDGHFRRQPESVETTPKVTQPAHGQPIHAERHFRDPQREFGNESSRPLLQPLERRSQVPRLLSHLVLGQDVIDAPGGFSSAVAFATVFVSESIVDSAAFQALALLDDAFDGSETGNVHVVYHWMRRGLSENQPSSSSSLD